MKSLQDIQSELRELIPVGISDVIKALKAALPEASEKYQLVLVLEGQLNETNKNRLLGVTSDEDLQLAYNRLRKDLLDLINGLTEEDLDPTQAAPAAAAAGGKQAKQGNVLYRIPCAMPLGQETRCVVRIAFDKATIVENIDLDEHVRLKDIRVSDIMLVELIDPAQEPVFQIRSLSTPEQFIEESEYTEWLFFVTPQRAGIFPLMLKVSVIELINGQERRRDIVLEEQVEIVADGGAEAAAGEPAETFKPAGYTLSLAAVAGEASPLPSPPRRIPAVFRQAAMAVAGVLAFSAVSWAMAPQEVEWLYARYLRDSEEGYQHYIDKFPGSRHREEAVWRKAVVGDRPEALIDYLEDYETGEHAGPALSGLRQREEEVWQIVRTAPERISPADYLRWFPEGAHLVEAGILLRGGQEIRPPTVSEPARDSAATATPAADTTARPAAPEPAPAAPNPPAAGPSAEEQAWETARSTATIPALQGFLKQYPRGAHAAEAGKLLDELKRREETAFWEAQSRLNTAAAYNAYLKRYPKGLYAEEARNRLAALQPPKPAAVASGTVGSARLGGKTYPTIRLSGLTWMTQNLDYETPGSWHHGRIDDPAEQGLYGRLYTWAAAKRACAAVGWRLPTDEEWQAMADPFSVTGDDGRGLTESTHRALFRGGSSGFSAVLGGGRDPDSGFYDLGVLGYYWSATETQPGQAWAYIFYYNSGKLYRNEYGVGWGLSCRCVRE